MGTTTQTSGQILHQTAVQLAKQKVYEAFRPFYSGSFGLGNFLVILILLGLWQRSEYEKLKRYALELK